MQRSFALLAVFFLLGMVGGYAVPAALLGDVQGRAFPDVDPVSLEGEAAAALKADGVISGFPDGTFKGYLPVNRAQAAKMLLLAAGIDVKDLPNNGRFRDVVSGQWYVMYVMTAAKEGIIAGYPDGTFRPDNRINTAEFLKMITLAFTAKQDFDFSWRDVSSLDWFAVYVGIAELHDLFPGRTDFLYPASQLTRRDTAIAIHRMVEGEGMSSSAAPRSSAADQTSSSPSSSFSSFSSFSSSSPPPPPPPPPAAGQPRVIRVTARNWNFEPKTIRVKQGESVELELQSMEGVHGFYLPSLGVDEVLVNGIEPVRVPLKTDSAGTFPFLCSVPCGEGHAEMHGEVIVEPR